MENSALMGMMDSASHLGGEASALAGREARAALLEPLGKTAPFYQLHAEEMDVLRFADLEDGNDIGVVQIGRRLRFGPKPLNFIVGCQPARANELQCDDAMQTSLACPPNHAHSACRDQVDQLVVTKATPRFKFRVVVTFNDLLAGQGHQAFWAQPFRRLFRQSGSAFGTMVICVHVRARFPFKRTSWGPAHGVPRLPPVEAAGSLAQNAEKKAFLFFHFVPATDQNEKFLIENFTIALPDSGDFLGGLALAHADSSA